MDLKQRVEQLEREKQALINMHENYYGEALQRAEFAKKETQAVWDRCQEEIKELTAREEKLVKCVTRLMEFIGNPRDTARSPGGDALLGMAKETLQQVKGE